jgi:hypothetical protein
VSAVGSSRIAQMKVVCLLLLGVCALVMVDALQMDRASAGAFAQVHGTRCGRLHCPYDNAICCPGKTGHVGYGQRKASCCPDGYQCSFPDQRPTTCVKRASTSVTINPTLAGTASGGSPTAAAQVAGSAASPSMASMSSMGGSFSSSTSDMPGSASGSAAADPMASVSGSAAVGSASAAMGSASASATDPTAAAQQPSNVPKFRQNIIIVKNINVLTKLQQPPKGGTSSSSEPAPAQESTSASASGSASEESSESGSRSEESTQSGTQSQ